MLSQGHRARKAPPQRSAEATAALLRVVKPIPTDVGWMTIHHIANGPTVMREMDARHALTFRNEWSQRPWPAASKGAEDV